MSLQDSKLFYRISHCVTYYLKALELMLWCDHLKADRPMTAQHSPLRL